MLGFRCGFVGDWLGLYLWLWEDESTVDPEWRFEPESGNGMLHSFSFEGEEERLRMVR